MCVLFLFQPDCLVRRRSGGGHQSLGEFSRNYFPNYFPSRPCEEIIGQPSLLGPGLISIFNLSFETIKTRGRLGKYYKAKHVKSKKVGGIRPRWERGTGAQIGLKLRDQRMQQSGCGGFEREMEIRRRDWNIQRLSLIATCSQLMSFTWWEREWFRLESLIGCVKEL